VNLQRTVFARLYRRSPDVESLPWHREEPSALLEQVLAERPPGRALDLGCGQGVQAVHLAERGWAVTGIDFVPAAIAAARARAARAGVEVELLEQDVLAYEAAAPFDLVLDSGCLHHLPKGRVADYRRRLDGWLAPGGDYVLVHFAHRPRIPIPKGPNHLTREQAVELFAPYEPVAHDETHYDVPLPMGRMRAGVHRFRRVG